MTVSNVAYAKTLMAGGLSYQAASIAAGVYEPDLRRLAARPVRRPVAISIARVREPLRFVPPNDVMTPLDAIKRLISDVGEARGFTYNEIMAPRCERGATLRPLAHVRQAAMYAVLQAYPNMSRVRLGKIMGRDHSTVVHGLKAHEARLLAARQLGADQ